MVRLTFAHSVRRRWFRPITDRRAGAIRWAAQLVGLLDQVPLFRGRVGRPRHRPATLIADRGYDYDTYRRLALNAASSR